MSKDKHPSLTKSSFQKSTKTYFKSKEDYEKQLKEVQIELLTLQQKILREKRKLIIVLEGHDTAGKGGVVRRISQYLDPRGLHVHGIGKPDIHEAGQHYFQRFFERLPKPGTIGIFDRSWYGRVLVERVEGFAAKPEWKRAFKEINDVEQMLQNDGIVVLKYLLDISHKEQGARFKEREKDPLKSWKLTDEDYRNRSKWNKYYDAFNNMIERTSPKSCPWTVVPADSKWFTRVKILGDIVERA